MARNTEGTGEEVPTWEADTEEFDMSNDTAEVEPEEDTDQSETTDGMEPNRYLTTTGGE